METWQIVLLGIIQGITEFFPISSSGHLILIPKILHFQDQGLTLDAVLHLATLLVIIIFFKSDLAILFKSLFDKKDTTGYQRVAWSIVLASFPAGLTGLMLGDLIETQFRNPLFVGANLMFWSFVFLAADRRGTYSKNALKEIWEIRLSQALLVGFAQALALFPGTSRSGITIGAGLFVGLKRETAARFSFLLGTPIILAAGLYKFASLLIQLNNIPYSIEQLLVGFAAAFTSGYISIKALLSIVTKIGLLPFIIYRIVFSLFIFIFFL